MLKVPQVVERVALDQKGPGAGVDRDHCVDVHQAGLVLLDADQTSTPEQKALSVLGNQLDSQRIQTK